MLEDARIGSGWLQIRSARDNRATSMRCAPPSPRNRRIARRSPPHPADTACRAPTAYAAHFAIVVMLLTSATLARAEWLAPLTLETAQTIPSGEIDLALGVSYFRNRRFPPFTPAGFIQSQNLVAAPELGIRGAVGSMVEIQASYEFINNDEDTLDGHNNTYGGGDARLFTKIYALRERKWIPAMGFRFGTKLPNASSSERLGTDQLDFFLQWLGSKQLGPVDVHLNLGIALLDNPGFNGSDGGGQDDLFTYVVGLVSPTLALNHAATWGIRFLAEAAGQTGSRFDNDANDVRVGTQVTHGGFTLYAGASAGLSGAAEDYGVMGGVLYAFEVERLAALFD
jgi:hypothetical protein